MWYNLNLMWNLILQWLPMQPELNSCEKALAHMLYLRLKLTFHNLQPNDLITLRMRLKLKSQKKNSNLIDDPCN